MFAIGDQIKVMFEYLMDNQENVRFGFKRYDELKRKFLRQ